MEYCQYRGIHPHREIQGVSWIQCGNLAPSGGALCYAHDPARIAERKRAKVLAKAAPVLLAALKMMVAHTDELEDAWRRGALDERDTGGGTRSNRNIDVNRFAKATIADAEKEE